MDRHHKDGQTRRWMKTQGLKSVFPGSWYVLLSYISYWYVFCHIAEDLMCVVTFILLFVVIFFFRQSHLSFNFSFFLISNLSFAEQNKWIPQHNKKKFIIISIGLTKLKLLETETRITLLVSQLWQRQSTCRSG